jgi:hypothetical protein
MRLALLFAIIYPLFAFSDKKGISLFDGKTLAGWTDRQGGPPAKGWAVEDGCILRQSKAGDLYSKETFKDFEFSCEWKITAGTNSGIKYRVADYSGAMLGPEYQILDDAKWKYAPDHLGATASIYAIKGASADKKLKAPGEFNAKSKFKSRPDFGTKSGRIMLQEHGGQVRFRNLKIRKL